MSIKDIFEQSTTIQINVMKIDGKQLKKSHIEQFGESFPFDENYEFTGEKVFGYVTMEKTISTNPLKTNTYWGICEVNGKIKKFKADGLRNIANLTLDRYLYRVGISSYYNLLKLKNVTDSDIFHKKYLNDSNYFDQYLVTDMEAKISDVLTEESITKLNEIIKNAKEFSDELREHQIFI